MQKERQAGGLMILHETILVCSATILKIVSARREYRNELRRRPNRDRVLISKMQ